MRIMKKFFSALTAITLTCGLIFALAPARAQAGGPNPVVVMQTTMGPIMVMLYPKEAPKTVANFLKYVDAGFYNKTIFHRVIRKTTGKDAMGIVQGGGFVYPVQRKRPLFPPIANESATSGLSNTKGTIAMARTNNPNSATCEFFFNVMSNPSFDNAPGYCAFGKVIRGQETLEKINRVQTSNRGGMQDMPVSPIYLVRAYRAR